MPLHIEWLKIKTHWPLKLHATLSPLVHIYFFGSNNIYQNIWIFIYTINVFIATSIPNNNTLIWKNTSCVNIFCKKRKRSIWEIAVLNTIVIKAIFTELYYLLWLITNDTISQNISIMKYILNVLFRERMLFQFVYFDHTKTTFQWPVFQNEGDRGSPYINEKSLSYYIMAITLLSSRTCYIRVFSSNWIL